MPVTSLFTSVAVDHLHVEEDLSSEVDGYKLIFNTNQIYIPGSLIVLYSGATYTVNNDFYETGPKEITFVNEDPFPPEVGCPLILKYRRSPTT